MLKNILYLHETSRISGAEQSLLQLVNRLDRNRFCPYFALPDEGPFALRLRAFGIEVNTVHFPALRRLLGVRDGVAKLHALMETKNIHLTHSQSIRTHMYAALASKKLRLPVIWHERNLITYELSDPDRMFSFLPDRIICNSQAIAKRFMHRGVLPSKVRVVYNGVDTDLFYPQAKAGAIRRELGIGSDEFVIGIASRFGDDKGHTEFLQAARIVLNDRSFVQQKPRFLLAGGAVFDDEIGREKELRRLASEWGMQEHVVFSGIRDAMPEVYAAMDVVVLASYAEPCGRVVIEAMSCGRPVIGTNSGGTPEIIEDGATGFLVKPRDAGVLAEKIIFLAKQRNVREEMGRKGRQRIERDFTIQKNVERIQAVYFELAQ